MSSAGLSLTAPPQTMQPPFPLDDAPDGRRIELDRGHGLHGVGRAGRRCDRARRVFGIVRPSAATIAHDDRRGAIAGKPADAMLVHDDAGRPSQPFAGLDHRMGQREDLLVVERRGRRKRS